MADRLIFFLNDGWALGADDKQWMLLRGRKRHAETVWQPIAFIASTKDILRRCMANNGVQPTSEAEDQLNALPECFRDWRSTYTSKSNVRGVA